MSRPLSEMSRAELVDEVVRLQQRNAALAAHVERLRKAALDAIHHLPGGEVKAELRDAYDDITKARGEQ